MSNNRYIITVCKNDEITILIKAKDKIEAITKFAKEYNTLHDVYNWQIKRVDFEL